MPTATVITAASLQYSLAAAFLITPALAHRHGAAAQRAAEAELARQDADPATLTRRGIDFSATTTALAISTAIALTAAALATLNLAGHPTGRLLSLILHPVLFLAGGLITAAQVFVTPYLRAAFQKSGDPALQRVDAAALVTAALRPFPSWFRHLTVTRFALTTAGSLAVIALLAL
ncbi:hypothetical protein ABGB17_16365 [Sphaerisporangium sp. B11E5]|uniref:hypothetical protein n=1 Tax=Sphaerisporangium sp. B11E5 TaxID=3153563 RepID=UPI00325DB1F8